MLESGDNAERPPIPGKGYFTIGEVSESCAVKPHVIPYREQQFPQLKPAKRRTESLPAPRRSSRSRRRPSCESFSQFARTWRW